MSLTEEAEKLVRHGYPADVAEAQVLAILAVAAAIEKVATSIDLLAFDERHGGGMTGIRRALNGIADTITEVSGLSPD
jgi:hypothetical protein